MDNSKRRSVGKAGEGYKMLEEQQQKKVNRRVESLRTQEIRKAIIRENT